MEQNSEHSQFSADLGEGRRVDFEMPANDAAWLVAGPGINLTDVWMKGVGGSVDLRVRIMRRGNVVGVSIDRGEQSVDWWPPEAAPRIEVTIDSSQGSASVSAAIGIRPRSPAE